MVNHDSHDMADREVERRLLALLETLVKEIRPDRGDDVRVSLASRLDRDLGLDSLARSELLLRLEAYVRAKLDADRVQETGLMDSATQFYNVHGLEYRSAELAAWAQRRAEPLSCVVLGFTGAGHVDGPKVLKAVEAMADILRETGRTSDVIGRTSQTEFAVLAPGADGQAAVRLAERLRTAFHGALASEGLDDELADLRGGYDTVADARDTPLKGPELITRATIAFRRARSERHGTWIKPFRPVPVAH